METRITAVRDHGTVALRPGRQGRAIGTDATAGIKASLCESFIFNVIKSAMKQHPKRPELKIRRKKQRSNHGRNR